MRIISDFKDYYDCMMAYATDKETFIIRNRTEPVLINSKNLPGYGGWDWKFPSCIIIGFAGVCYPILTWFDKKTVYNFDTDTFARKDSRGNFNNWWSYYQNIDNARKLFDSYGPIWSIHHGGTCQIGDPGYKKAWLHKNCCLNDFGFYKIKPPPIAFNDLYNYICNQAQPPKPIPEYDDETMAEIHGFNRKTSFRKPKADK